MYWQFWNWEGLGQKVGKYLVLMEGSRLDESFNDIHKDKGNSSSYYIKTDKRGLREERGRRVIYFSLKN